MKLPEAIETLKRFPSVELDTITYTEALSVLIAECEKSKWISVKERLPEVNQEVLCSDGEYVMNSIYERGEFYAQKYPSAMDRSISTYFVNITHWMSLPSIPQEPKP